VLSFLRSLSRDASLAEDLTQETYLRAYVHLSLHPKVIDNPRPWLFTIARCTYIDWLRHESVRPRTSLEAMQVPADARAEPLVQAVQTREDMRELERSIALLDRLSRDLLVGHHVDGECFADLAARHGVSVTGARTRVFRARWRCRPKTSEQRS